MVAILPIYDKNYFSIGAHRGVEFFAPPSYSGGAARCGRARVRAACARQSGLRAVWAAPGASWRRKPGRRAGLLGPPSGCWGPGRRPRWATGGCPPPGADRRPGSARSGGENRKFPPRRWLRSVSRGQPMATWQHGNMATWHRGTVASWLRGFVASWHVKGAGIDLLQGRLTRIRGRFPRRPGDRPPSPVKPANPSRVPPQARG